MMKYIKLDITNRHLSRDDFLNQADTLFVLPDNVPDFRLPRNRLHTSHNRGGLAACMRPFKIGGSEDEPVYDIAIVGVPTVSFVANEPLSSSHIQDAFAEIYRVLKTHHFQVLVVPYKNNEPAFGGGIAGELKPAIKQKIQEEFARLEHFLNQK